MYRYALLDPRPIPAAAEANDKILGAQTLGIEVTVPALAARCGLGNIDPQHSGGDATRAAIEEALSVEIPPEGATLATVRADLDAIGAMAILAIRARGEALESAMGRIELVAKSDKASRGGWPGVRPLPTTENPWPEDEDGQGTGRPLAAIGGCIADFKLPVGERVTAMETWLLSGEEPAKYREAHERERVELVVALESGAINAQTVESGRIAVVESTHRAATMVGYMLAPVVVALNPEFRVSGGEPHKKFTVGVFEAGKFADIKSALSELSTLEAGWGGSPTIGGSPQGVSSTLTIDQVVEVVTKHLK